MWSWNQWVPAVSRQSPEILMVPLSGHVMRRRCQGLLWSPGPWFTNAQAPSELVHCEFSSTWLNSALQQLRSAPPLAAAQLTSAVVLCVGHARRSWPAMVDTVQAPFTHSVQAMGPTADGYYVMYFVGAPAPSAVINCPASGIPPAYVHPNPPSMNLLSIAWSPSLVGPWAHRPLFFPNASAPQDAWDCAKTNPAPALLSNGTVLLAFRSTACSGGGTGEYLGIASAALERHGLRSVPAARGGTHGGDGQPRRPVPL